MLAKNVLIRPQGEGFVTISWTSDSPEMLSWIFINGVFAVGPFMAETVDRAVTLPVPTDKTYVVEVHDFEDIEEIPLPVEQKPLVKPQISWNCVELAAAYRIYHTIFDTGELAVPSQSAPGYAVANNVESGVQKGGSIESLLLQVPPMGVDRMEIDCPTTLEGRGGRWHSFRVESVDHFGNESENEVVPHFAVDLPMVPELSISRDIETGSLTFRII